MTTAAPDGLPTRGDITMTADEVVAELADGMTIGIGGWGSRRKPMTLVRAICRSSLTDLTVVSYGGPDVGLLCATGKARRLVYGFVSLDSIPLEPHFRAARQSGSIEASEYDEGMVYAGLFAAANRLPFMPIRAGLGSSVMDVNDGLRMVTSPYADADGSFGEFVAMPALHLDVALVHLDRADRHGNGQHLGPDLYFDDLFCQAADRAFMSCEQLVDTSALVVHDAALRTVINRTMVDGVVEAPGGAHFTSAPPDHDRDEVFQQHYAASARSDEAWQAFRERFVDVDEATYHTNVAAFREESP